MHHLVTCTKSTPVQCLESRVCELRTRSEARRLRRYYTGEEAPDVFNHLQSRTIVDVHRLRCQCCYWRASPRISPLNFESPVMDALTRAGLETWWTGNFKSDGKTSFHIVSSFAHNASDELDPQPPLRFSENQLKQCIAKYQSSQGGRLKKYPAIGEGEWHRSLADAQLLCPKPRDTTATLNIIYVHNEENSVFRVSAQTVLFLFEMLGLDYSFLPSLCRGSDTWLCTRRNDGSCSFLLIIQPVYCIAYSFSPLHRVTNCVCFGKDPWKIEDDLDETSLNFYQPAWYGDTFDRHKANTLMHVDWAHLQSKAHHLHHPLSLAYMGMVDSLTALTCQVNGMVRRVGKLEDVTSPENAQRPTNLYQLSQLSLEAGEMHTDIARISKSASIASLLLQTLESRRAWEKWTRRYATSGTEASHRLQNEAGEWMGEGLPSCRQMLQNEQIQVRSQDERVKALTQIVGKLTRRRRNCVTFS